MSNGNWGPPNNNGGPFGQYPPTQQYGQYGQPHQQYPQQYHQPAPIVVQQTTNVVKAPFNHTPHLILTILTCGGWLPIWIICAVCH